jgi:hypothetical protein
VPRTKATVFKHDLDCTFADEDAMRIAPHHRLIRRIARFIVLVGVCASFDALAQPEGVSIRAADAFYDPPAKVTGRPGALLRSEPFKDVTLTVGMRGWRIKYTTTVDDKTPITVVPTDYSFAEKDGPHPYLIGEGEARAGLDSVRAARKMPELRLSDRAAVWAHSQRGQSALWTGIVGPWHAPAVKIVGVAAIAPAADMKTLLLENVELAHRLGPYMALSYRRFYPDIKFEQTVRLEALAAPLKW